MRIIYWAMEWSASHISLSNSGDDCALERIRIRRLYVLFRLRSWALCYIIMPVIHWNYISTLNARYECGARCILLRKTSRCELAVRCGRFSSLWAPMTEFTIYISLQHIIKMTYIFVPSLYGWKQEIHADTIIIHI